ncbi:unnamed protein product [Soboliphyme baturini]|uniref:FRG domain-containing protein n=1 Tax=Soboliphyme baturini TaxID=241478 RepID=A0A183J664_9BILA|nr:unnamed protein product [Soboliphyme baturini]
MFERSLSLFGDMCPVPELLPMYVVQKYQQQHGDCVKCLNPRELYSRRLSTAATVLQRASETVRSNFLDAADFQAIYALIATWDRVGYYDAHHDKVPSLFVMPITYQTGFSAPGRRLVRFTGTALSTKYSPAVAGCRSHRHIGDPVISVRFPPDKPATLLYHTL